MKKFYQAFTLAEIMIVLAVIGVLTAILLPAAFHATPDENIMKFKKANSTLGTVIRELVNSDKYYLDGDLGVRANGALIDGNQEGDRTYFCETLAEVLSYKEKNCNDSDDNEGFSKVTMGDGSYEEDMSFEEGKIKLDEACLTAGERFGFAEIITADGISWYQSKPLVTYGAVWSTACPLGTHRVFGDKVTPCSKDDNGFDTAYKILCFDVDGVNKGEDPFGYGIRADGKIIPGARADEWIKKSVQGD